MVELSTESANPPTTEALQEELDALRQEATIHALSVASLPDIPDDDDDDEDEA